MERYAEPLFGLLFVLLLWWFVADVLDAFGDPFLSVIAFGAAIFSTLIWVYDFYEAIFDSGSDRTGPSGNSG